MKSRIHQFFSIVQNELSMYRQNKMKFPNETSFEKYEYAL